jgi:hypothetical protein
MIFLLLFSTPSFSNKFILDTTYHETYVSENDEYARLSFWTYKFSNSHIEEKIHFEYINDNKTQKYSRIIYLYDDFDRLIDETEQLFVIYNEDSTKWLNQKRNIYKFTEDAYFEIEQKWEFALHNYQWFNKKRWESYFDNDGNVHIFKYKRWENDDWSNIIKNSIFYDEFNRIDTLYSFLYYDGKWSENYWYVHDNKYENSHLIQRIVNIYDSGGGVPDSKSIFSYYNDSLALETHFSWHGTHFIKVRKVAYEYDEHMNLITETTFLPNSEDEWEPKERFRHVYKNITSVAERGGSPASARIFPNPAGEYLEYSLDEDISGTVDIRVTDMEGYCVLDLSGQSPQGRIDIGGLPPGLYFIELQTGDHQFNEKFIKSE